MGDEATLRDTVVNDLPQPGEGEKTPQATPPPEKTLTMDPADAEALEVGKVLIGAGYSKERVNDLLTAPQALESIKYALENDPEEFLAMLQRTTPKTYDKLMETSSTRYIKQFGEDAPVDKEGKPDPNANLLREIKAVKEELQGIRTKEAQRENAQYLASTRQRLDARYDDLFGREEIKALGLTKTERQSLQALANQKMSDDPAKVQRASSGNFVDVPEVFKQVTSAWVADKKAAIEDAAKAKENSEKGSFMEFPTGAEAFMDVSKIPSSTWDSWDSTETALADAFKRISR